MSALARMEARVEHLRRLRKTLTTALTEVTTAIIEDECAIEVARQQALKADYDHSVQLTISLMRKPMRTTQNEATRTGEAVTDTDSTQGGTSASILSE